jgi:hypothetical protein
MSWLNQVAISLNKHFNMHKFKCLLHTESVSVSDLRKKKKLRRYTPRRYRVKVPANKLRATGAVGSQRHAPTSLPAGKRYGTHFKGAGWAEGPVRLRPENLTPTGFEPWITQPVECRCTDWGIPASQLRSTLNIYLFVDFKPKFIWTNTIDLIFGVTCLCSRWLQTFSHLNKLQGCYWLDGPGFGSRWKLEFP